jgi:hypothetical protein
MKTIKVRRRCLILGNLFDELPYYANFQFISLYYLRHLFFVHFLYIAFDTGFPSSTQSQQQQQASVQTDILSSDNSYILDYSRNQFTMPAMVPSSYNQQVPDYFASEGDNTRYRM